ncbi:MAG: signal recognition particle-docking protein FtsY [Candidatus Baldrarchaeia archaeon]
MFGLLKEKLSKVVKRISENVEKKKPVEREVEVKKVVKKGIVKKVFEKVTKKVLEKKISEKDLEGVLGDLEISLLEADVAFEVSEKIKDDLKKNLVGKQVKRGKVKDIIIEAFKNSLSEILDVPEIDLKDIIKKAKKENRPAVLVFFGINGVGKSLNLSKVAYWLKNKGYRPILAAGDTFRAAGDIQLEKYAEAINVPVIKHEHGSDSCAVIFDARIAAKARGFDIVLADTSGRMHTQKNLIDELAKICRVNKPDLKILVLDSLSGSDVISQLEFFDKAVGVDAIIFSKVDINEKGGNILSVCYSYEKPILFLGNGQGYDDLLKYDPKGLIENLLTI